MIRFLDSSDAQCIYMANIPEYIPIQRNNWTSLVRVQVKAQNGYHLTKEEPFKTCPNKSCFCLSNHEDGDNLKTGRGEAIIVEKKENKKRSRLVH